MIERAGRLENAAASREMSARNMERDATNLVGRARVLRSQASFVDVADRSGLLSLADELVARAETERFQAANERAQASELRMQARALRDRALQLVRLGGGDGGGWRKRPVGTPAAEGSVTL
jgi:hypothetical protein